MNQMMYEDTSFLAGGGEMGDLMRQHEWHQTSLGAPAQWPQALKVAVRILLSSGHPMFIWWGPELLQFYNDAFRRSIGPERHPSALGQAGRACWQEIWPVIGPQIEQVMAGNGSTWNENHLVPITRNGQRQEVYWTYSYSPIDDPAAPYGVGGVLVITSETTLQVLNGMRWQAAEAKWRSLFDQAPVFMCTLTGPQHFFEHANSEYLKLVGGREIIGKSVKEALPEVVAQGFISLLDNVYQTGEAFRGYAAPVDLMQNPLAVSERRFVDFVFQPLTNNANQVVGILVVGYDVTERILAERNLQEQDRRKDEFLAMLAHELRNPLAPIANIAHWLIQPAIDHAEVKQAGEILQRQCGQLTHLVDDLLDVSRITRGKVELELEPVDVDQVVKLALEAAQPLLKAKRHKLSYQRGGGEYFVQGDLPRLVQCVSNVLTNAIKYTPPEGSIQVTVEQINIEQVGANVSIEIADNGVGISPEMLSRVFELFTQADPSIDRAQGGLGIGLSIVHRLVLMHSGTITAASDGAGRGSRFTFRLPLIGPPQQQVEQCDADHANHYRVLIVDDNIDAAQSLARLLAFQGHETLAVHTAREGLQNLDSFAPDVALLDIGLPDINGYDLARRIRAWSNEILLVALTGYGSVEDHQHSEAAGFDHHLTKPATLSELQAVIAQERTTRS